MNDKMNLDENNLENQQAVLETEAGAESAAMEDMTMEEPAVSEDVTVEEPAASEDVTMEEAAASEDATMEEPAVSEDAAVEEAAAPEEVSGADSPASEEASPEESETEEVSAGHPDPAVEASGPQSEEGEGSPEDDLSFDASDLIENPSTRLPICLCLDVSGSMVGEAIQELNEGVKVFFEALKEDEVALYAADLSIVTFDSQVKVIQEFSSLADAEESPVFEVGDMTYMGEAVNTVLDLLEKRKEEYQANGVDYYQPWLVLMTDGSPNGDEAKLGTAISRTTELIKNRKLTTFPIGIGEFADLASLEKFSPNRKPLRLQGLKFKEFFSWLSQSVAVTSQSMPGTSVPLDVEGLKGWADLSA